MRFFVIADENTVLGFKLVGIEGEIVDTADAAREALEKAFSASDIGIIIITERIAESIKEEIEDYLFKQDFPLIIQVPDRGGVMEGRVSVREIVNAAVGVKI